MLRAVLLLENRLIRGAFTAGRLDAVKLIAGQLAVSLDNAQLYAEFRRIADEQAALRRVATLVARGVPAGCVFAAVAEEVGGLLGADTRRSCGSIRTRRSRVMGGYGVDARSRPGWRGDASTPGWPWRRSQVHRPGGPARIERTRTPSGPMPDTAQTGAPRRRRRARSWSRAGCGAPSPPGTRGARTAARRAEQRLADFTELVATAIANAESRAELTTSRARIVAAADQARRRIERDLHDGAQQRLVSLALQLRAARAAVPPELGDLGADSSIAPPPRRPARSTSCARSRAASTRRSWPRAACARR